MKDIVILGDSTSEILDYIFGYNPQYHPLWASGWSARGLIDNQFIKVIDDYLKNLDRNNTIILLNFGYVDIFFNIAYKVHNTNYYNFPNFLNEILAGVSNYYNYLKKSLGFNDIFFCMFSPPIRECIFIAGSYLPLPNCLSSSLFNSYYRMLRKIFDKKVIDCIPFLTDSDGFCKEEFVRQSKDYHIDYVKAQDCVFERLLDKFSMDLIPRRNPKHEKLYPHQPHSFHDVKFNHMLRKNTCR